MNKVYRVVWNTTRGLWQVAAELGAGRRAKKGGRSARRSRATQHALATALLLPLSAWSAELPTGGIIKAGVGRIEQAGQTMTITQSTDRLAVDWQSFSIGEGQRVQFVQPGDKSVALNRVIGSDPSRIFGALEANGRVYLVNPNGVLFGESARVNVGALAVSTLDLGVEDFMAGDLTFEGDSAAMITNLGRIAARDGGYIALIAARVENIGEIAAPGGDVALGAGRRVRLDLGGPVRLEIEEGALDALIEQGGAIRADGGRVLLTAAAASDLASTVINHTGVTEARGLEAGPGGEIVLLGDGGNVEVGGKLDVSSAASAGGRAVITGEHVRIGADAHVDARGVSGGGDIYVGGGWQGSDASIANASTTEVAAGAHLDASATSGDAGTVVVWADGDTQFAGEIHARGGAGGDVEVSGKESLTFAGNVDTGGGRLLLDPAYIYIRSTDGDLSGGFSGNQLAALLAANDVTLQADSQIKMHADATLDYNGLGTERTLTLIAPDIVIQGQIIDSAPGDDALSLTLRQNKNNMLLIEIKDTATLHLGNDANVTIDGYWVKVDGSVQVGGTGNISVKTSSHYMHMDGGTLRVADGNLQVDAYSGVTVTGGAVIEATGSGNVDVKTSSSSLNANGGYIRTNTGAMTLTANSMTINNSLSGSGALTIQPASPSMSVGIGTSGMLNISASALNSILSSNFSDITFGRTDATGLEVRNVTFDRNVTLRGGNITASGVTVSSGNLTMEAREKISLTGAISNAAGAIRLHSGTGVSQQSTANIVAKDLLLTGAGNVNLGGSPNNSVVTLAANIDGAFTYRNTGALVVGSVAGTEGVAASGTIDISTDSGNLTIDRSISSLSTADNALVLNAGRLAQANNAPGGDIVLNANLTVGDGGRATLYTGSIAGSTGLVDAAGGAGSGHFRYASDESTTNYTASLGEGTYAIYRERPVLLVAPGNAESQYGNAPDLSSVTYTISGYRNGDSGNVDGIATYSTTATAADDVGAYDIAYVGGLTSALGYALADNTAMTGEYAIVPRVLNLTGSFLVDDKVYDGGTAASISSSSLALEGLVGTEDLDLTGFVARFEDKHAGTDKTVHLTTVSLADGVTGKASNYTVSLSGAPTATASITPKALTVSGLVALDKEYDGTTIAHVDASGVSFVGLLAGDEVLVDATGTFSDKNVGTGKTVTLSGTYAGADAGNYAITGQTTTTANITPKALVVAAIDQTAYYDGAIYDDGFSASYSGFVTGEDESVLTGALAFGGDAVSARNAGEYSISLSGLSTQNYTVEYVDGTLTILPASLSISTTDVTKTYDGTTFAAGTAVAVEGTQLFGTDTLSGGDFAFTTPGAGTGKTVTVSNVAIDDGNGGNNYVVSYVDNTTSTIEQAPLTVRADDKSAVADGEVYDDGFSVSYVGFVAGEDQSVLRGEPTFGGASLGAIAPGEYDITVSGFEADNYAISYESGVLTIEPVETPSPRSTPSFRGLWSTAARTRMSSRGASVAGFSGNASGWSMPGPGSAPPGVSVPSESDVSTSFGAADYGSDLTPSNVEASGEINAEGSTDEEDQ